MALSIKCMLWFLTFFGELGITFNEPCRVNEDNKACISVMSDVAISDKTKHIQNKIWLIRSHMTTDSFCLVYTPTGEMLADALTKSLFYDEFAKFFKLILGYKSKKF